MTKQISMERLGVVVKERREKWIGTQQALEDRTGINRQTIGRIEAGKFIPSIPQLNKLMETLKFDYEDIMEERKQNVFVSMMGEARTPQEKEGFEKMISMILCLRKYERLGKIHG